MESGGRQPISTDELAFLRAIWEAPNDDAPRLIFADWLDDHYEYDYAAYIRRGVEYYRYTDNCRDHRRESLLHSVSELFTSLIIDKESSLYRRIVRRDLTKLSEGVLHLSEVGAYTPCEPQPPYTTSICMAGGFVRYVDCPLSVWRVNIGPQVAHHPIDLRITDRLPFHAVDRHTDIGRLVYWSFRQFGNGHSSSLPVELRPYLLRVGNYIPNLRATSLITDSMLRYKNPQTALKALGEALLLEARERHVITHPTFSQSSPTPDTESAPA